MKPCDVEGVDDFSRYYRNSYIPFKGKACRVMMVDGNTVILRISSEDKTSPAQDLSTTWGEIKKSPSFGVPSLGLRNLGPSIGYLSISPSRQSQRGYLPGNTFLHQFNSWETRRNPIPNLDSWVTANEVFFPTFYQTPEALDLLETGKRIGCAISPNVGVYTSNKSVRPLISYKQQTVGYFYNSPILLERHSPLFHSIVKDLGLRKYVERKESGEMVTHHVR